MTNVVIVDAVRTPIGAFGGALSSLPASHMGAIVIKALLERNPRPSREEVAHALDGNLCRCTGYEKIFTGVERAAAAMRGES